MIEDKIREVMELVDKAMSAAHKCALAADTTLEEWEWADFEQCEARRLVQLKLRAILEEKQ